MIAIDTNVLLRLLIEDDEDQYRHALELLDKLNEQSEEVIITSVTLCETAWVLKRGYKATKSEIHRALDEIVTIRGLRIADYYQYLKALESYKNGKGDFADYLLREQAVEVGCRAVATFDKALLKEEGFFRP